MTAKILAAFDQACDQGDVEVARMLLACCDRVVCEADLPLRNRRTMAEPLHSAHERLWCMRHAEIFDDGLVPRHGS